MAPGLPGLGKDGSAMVNVSNFTTTKILDRKLSSSSLKYYMCKLVSPWYPADLVGKVQMAHVHIRATRPNWYERDASGY